MIELTTVQSSDFQVLLVDAHQEATDDIAKTLTANFPEAAPVFTAAHNQAEALARANEQEFHLALLELHLPDGSGLDLLRLLRELHPMVQVVVITGDGNIENVIRALHEGVAGYVLKPFSTQQLTEMTHNAILRSKSLRERESLREQLEAAARCHREVIDQVPALILALDGEGKIALWNKQLEKVTGFTADERLGTDGTDLIDDTAVMRLALKAGGHRSVRWKRTVVPSADGTSELQYAAGVDVTEERETQLRAMRAERLAAVGTLAAGLAHEVRNPLNSATLQLQMLQRKTAQGAIDSEGLSRTIQIVKSELERLDSLVDDFLAFAEPKPFTAEVCDLNELAQGVVELLGAEAARERVTLNTDFAPDLGRLPLDPQGMRQVVVNLIRNAIEATGPHGTVLVKTLANSDEASVQLSIIDDGPGFPDGTPVFDAFYTTKDSGTGLGLSIVHRTVSEHGGRVTVTSEPGQTAFVVELPQPESVS